MLCKRARHQICRSLHKRIWKQTQSCLELQKQNYHNLRKGKEIDTFTIFEIVTIRVLVTEN